MLLSLGIACTQSESEDSGMVVEPPTNTDDKTDDDDNTDNQDDNTDVEDETPQLSIYTYTPNNSPDEFEVIEELTDEFEEGYDSEKWELVGESRTVGFPTWDYKGENVAVNDGCVELTIKHDPRENRSNGSSSYTYADDIYFSSGMLRSWTTTTYGYYEARIKGTKLQPTIAGYTAEQTMNMGACSGFWLYTDVTTGKASIPADGNEHAVYYNEIDILELNQVPYNPYIISQNLHIMVWEDGAAYFASADKHPEMGLTQVENSGWDSAADYHLYACENRPDSIIFYVDNQRIASKPNSFWHLDGEVDGGMNLTISLGLRNPFEKYVSGVRTAVETTFEEAAAAGFPTTSSIDYVRAWRRKDNYESFPSSQREWQGKEVEQ